MSKEFKIEHHGRGGFFWDETRSLISKYRSVCQIQLRIHFGKKCNMLKMIHVQDCNLEKETLYQKNSLKNIKMQFSQRIY